MRKRIAPDDWIPVDVKKLEDAAIDVVKSSANVGVVAGPGAGKTELLAQRASFLLQTNLCPDPKKILAISFKKDAAENLAERVEKRCGKELASRFDSKTFDAFSKGLLDRFLEAIPTAFRPSVDYEIPELKNPAIKRFLTQLKPPEELIQKERLYSVDVNSFMKELVLAPLPLQIQFGSALEWAAIEFWNDALRGSAKSKLTFPMIGRLATYMLVNNPAIIRAIRSTYSHVFLDEFQDTTHVQFDLVKTAFLGSSAVLTAVGDNKQRIMGWAMALPDAFYDYNTAFAAKGYSLLMNYRSSPYLVQIQHHLIAAIDSQSVKPISGVDVTPGSICDVLVFPNTKSESVYVGNLIFDLIHNDKFNPRDICILTKQTPDVYSGEIIDVLRAKNIEARNEVVFQDLLKEPITEILLTFLKLASRDRARSMWTETIDILSKCRGQFDQEVTFLDYEKELSEFRKRQRNKMKNTKSKDHLNAIIRDTVDFIDERSIRGMFPQYQQGDFFEGLLSKITENLWKYLSVPGASWSKAIDGFEGASSVPIMTVHKSKGLEFKAVIFVGFEDSAFWNFKNQRHEDTCTFFVAFSRAKQKVFFTVSEMRMTNQERGVERQSTVSIRPLFDLLASAGIQARKVV